MVRGVPIVRGREDLPGATAFATGENIVTVMTYNIHSGRGADGVLDLDRTRQVIEASGAQLVALQEVDRWTLRTGLVDQMKALVGQRPWQYAYGPNLFLPPGFYGNALLSVYPIRESSHVSLPSPRETRGFLRAVVQVTPSQDIVVYVTHLGLNQNEREQHVKMLLHSVRDEKLPVILMGDFNAEADSAEIGALKEVLHDLGASERQATFPSYAPAHRIDYIFVCDGFEVKNLYVSEHLASDHLPVVARLLLVE